MLCFRMSQREFIAPLEDVCEKLQLKERIEINGNGSKICCFRSLMIIVRNDTFKDSNSQ